MRLSIHLMVLNGATVVERALRPLREIADEICFVDTGSSDGTPDLLVRLSAELGMRCAGVAVSPLSYPDLYFPDLPSSFRRKVPGPFSGLSLLRDWSAARNLGLDLCTGDYVMKLDADDEVLVPENVLPALEHLEARPAVDFLMCPYEVMDPATGEVDRVEMYTRFWRRRPETYFREVCHENVDWRRGTTSDGPNWLMVPRGLSFRDHRDSPGRSVRVVHRNLKILLREYERIEAAAESLRPEGLRPEGLRPEGLRPEGLRPEGLRPEGLRPERPTAHLAMYLAQEAARVLPRLALEILHEWIEELDLHPQDAAWRDVVRGECLEEVGESSLALASYGRAALRGSRRASLLRALLRQEMGNDGWRGELAAAIALNRGRYYPQGASLREVARAEQILDESNVGREKGTR